MRHPRQLLRLAVGDPPVLLPHRHLLGGNSQLLGKRLRRETRAVAGPLEQTGLEVDGHLWQNFNGISQPLPLQPGLHVRRVP